MRGYFFLEPERRRDTEARHGNGDGLTHWMLARPALAPQAISSVWLIHHGCPVFHHSLADLETCRAWSRKEDPPSI
jgi:hypothetical protein